MEIECETAIEVVMNDERATKNYHQPPLGECLPLLKHSGPQLFTVLVRSRRSHICNRQMLFVGKL